MKRLAGWLRHEPVRVYVYGLVLAVVALLVAYGRLRADLAPLWLAGATALLAVPAAEGARARVSPVEAPGSRRLKPDP